MGCTISTPFVWVSTPRGYNYLILDWAFITSHCEYARTRISLKYRHVISPISFQKTSHGGYVVYSRGCAPVHEVNGRVCHFCQVRFRQALLVHHCPCNLYYVPVLPLNYAVLLRCVTAWEILSDSFLSKIRCKLIREIFFDSIWSKAAYVPTHSFFDFGFEILEVTEHFAFLPHRVDAGMHGEVLNECNIVSAPAECGYLDRSPCI